MFQFHLCLFVCFRVAAENELANQSDIENHMQTDSNGTTPDGELSLSTCKTHREIILEL